MRGAAFVLGCAAVAVACNGSPTGPTRASAARATTRTIRLSRTRFMAFGDSLTTGEVTAPVSLVTGSIGKLMVVPAASYPTQLQAQLAARYPSQAASIAVVNAGLGGETIVSGALRFADALDNNAPEAVIVMEGVNGLEAIGAAVSTQLMRDMSRAAKAQGVRVFIASMLPTIAGRQRSQTASELEGYNARLRQMSAEEGIVFVDLYTTLLPEVLSVIGVDGLHPTEAGYRRVADVFLAAISTELEEK